MLVLREVDDSPPEGSDEASRSNQGMEQDQTFSSLKSVCTDFRGNLFRRRQPLVVLGFGGYLAIKEGGQNIL